MQVDIYALSLPDSSTKALVEPKKSKSWSKRVCLVYHDEKPNENKIMQRQQQQKRRKKKKTKTTKKKSKQQTLNKDTLWLFFVFVFVS